MKSLYTKFILAAGSVDRQMIQIFLLLLIISMLVLAGGVPSDGNGFPG